MGDIRVILPIYNSPTASLSQGKRQKKGKKHRGNLCRANTTKMDEK
jgi:hypothetical protein